MDLKSPLPSNATTMVLGFVAAPPSARRPAPATRHVAAKHAMILAGIMLTSYRRRPPEVKRSNDIHEISCYSSTHDRGGPDRRNRDWEKHRGANVQALRRSHHRCRSARPRRRAAGPAG